MRDGGVLIVANFLGFSGDEREGGCGKRSGRCENGRVFWALNKGWVEMWKWVASYLAHI